MKLQGFEKLVEVWGGESEKYEYLICNSIDIQIPQVKTY